MITFLNFDGSSVGTLPAGFTNTTTIPGHTGNFSVGATGSISSPNSLYDASGLTGGSVLWTGFLAADQAIQFDQVVSLSGGVMNPLIRMSASGQTGYGVVIHWATAKIDFIVMAAGGSSTTIASPSIPTYVLGAQVTIKLEVQGANLRFKSWLTGTTEPTSWTASTTDSTYSSAGYVGFSNGGGSADNAYFGPAGSTFAGGFVAPVLSSGGTTTSSAQLSWTAAGQSAGATSYVLMRSPHGANTFAAISGTISPVIDATVAASTSYDYKVVASDGINAPVSSNILNLTIPGVPAATGWTLTGPASGIVGTASPSFTVKPNGHYSGTITITPAGCGLSTPIVLTFAGSSAPQTFTITPTSNGTVTLTPTNGGGLTNPNGLTYHASTTATSYALTGPTAGTQGMASAPFTVAPNGPYSGTITITPAGCGLSTPIVLTFAGSSAPQTFTITPTSNGTVTLTPTNGGGLADSSGLSYASTLTSVAVAGSGQSILVEFMDSSGNPANLTALQGYNDLQTLSLGGIPSGGQFALNFNGQTTAPISVSLVPPGNYALFTVPVTPGTTIQVAVDVQQNSTNGDDVQVDLIDGDHILATGFVNNVTGAIDSTATHLGQTIPLKNIGTVTPAGSSLRVLYTFGPATTIQQATIAVLAVTVVSTSTPTYYSSADTTVFSHAGHFLFYPDSGSFPWTGGTWIAYDLSFDGPLAQVTAAAIQSALLGLSSVASGGLTVTDQSGGGTGPYPIAFGGSMGQTAQPAITASDPAVTIAHTVVGGGVPSIAINGGSAIPIPTWIWASTSHSAPYALGYLPQAAPAASYYPIYQGLSSVNGNWSAAPSGGFSGQAAVSNTAGDIVITYCEGLPPGDYQVAASWIADPTLSPGTLVSIESLTGTVGTATTLPPLGDPTFSSISVGSSSFAYSPTGTPWTFPSISGISGNNSGFTNPADGNIATPGNGQVAFIQRDGSLTQTFAGWQAGSYSLSFQAAPRYSGGVPQTFNGEVQIDGVTVFSFTPAAGAYNSYSTPAFTVTAGTHTIGIVGLNTAVDNTAFFTNFSIGIAIDQSSPAADFTDQGVGWRILGTITTVAPATGLLLAIGNPGGKIGFDAFRVARTSPAGVQIAPTDTVTINLPANWATTTAGTSAALVSATVVNHSGGTNLPPLVSNVKSLGIGYNVEPDINYQSGFLYSNLAQRLVAPLNNALTSNANGYPTLLSAPTSPGNCCLYNTSDQHGKNRGWLNAPNGPYTILWDGTDDVHAVATGYYTQTELTQYQSLGNATNNRRVYNLQADGIHQIAPEIFLTLAPASGPDGNGHYPCNVTNLRVYPPDPSDPTHTTPWGISSTPPKWHPSGLAKLAGTKALRFMDWLSTNLNAVVDFTDFRQPGMLITPTRTINAAVATITAPTVAPAYFDPVRWVTLEITTTAPHGLDGDVFGTLTLGGTGTISDGSTVSGSFGGQIHVVNPTVLQIQYTQGASGRTLTNTVTGGTIAASIGTAGVFVDTVDLCNQVGADLWINIPTTCTDACVTAMAAYIATHLNTGLKVHVEYANECWNTGFATFYWCRTTAYRQFGADNDAAPGQVYQSKRVHNLFLAAMTSAGRSGDVIRVMGTQGGNPVITTNICTDAISQGMTFDAIATAPYIDNASTAGDEPSFQAEFDLMTVGQSLDYLETTIEYGLYDNLYVTQHKNILAAHGFGNVALTCYEGGFQYVVPGHSTVNGFARSHAIVRHPRAFACMARLLQKMQDAGCSLIEIFYAFGAGYVQGYNPVTAVPLEWSTYIGWNQQPGTGNATTDAINISDPEAVDQIKSEVGGAINLWNSLVPNHRTSNSPKAVFRQFRTTGTGVHGWKHS